MSTTSSTGSKGSVLTSILYFWMAVIVGFGLYAVWRAWNRAAGAADAVSVESLSPAERRQQEILRANADQPTDPDLTSRFAAINAQHFSGTLPPTTVRWEPALAGVGGLERDGITLEGMFGEVSHHGMILLNPDVRADPHAVDRALCHEMVHAHLFAIGDKSTRHGPAFQAVLKRLADEGAFEGIAANEEEKVSLRAWLDAEGARLDDERQAIDKLNADIAQTRADIDRAIAAFNARTPSPGAEDEARGLESRKQTFNDNLRALNERLSRDSSDVDHFNHEVTRYNLMIAYPDGLDEETAVRPKTAASPGR